MKTNMAIICLLDNYSKNVSKLLSERLEMYYVNVEEMVQFELGDQQHILKTLGEKEGKKYIEKCEERVVKNVTSFENTIICINPTPMFSNKNFERIIETCYVVYLQISPKFFEQRCKFSGDYIDEELANIAFTDRDKHYVQNSDIVINCSTFKEQKTAKKLLKRVIKFFKKISKEKRHAK